MDIVTFLSAEGIRVNHKEVNNAYIECPNCGERALPHHVCGSCGHYRNREVVSGVGA